MSNDQSHEHEDEHKDEHEAGPGPLAPDDEFALALDEILNSPDPDPSRPGRRAMPAEQKWNGMRHGVKDLSHVHEAIMNWLIANPEKNMGECAAAFGYSRAWLSILVHSNCFQARLKEKQAIIFSAVVGDIKDKLGALADVGLEKLQEEMETTKDKKFIRETTEMALKSMGFGQKTASVNAPLQAQNVQQNNFYVASPSDLEAARKMLTGASVSSPATLPMRDATPTADPPPSGPVAEQESSS